MKMQVEDSELVNVPASQSRPNTCSCVLPLHCVLTSLRKICIENLFQLNMHRESVILKEEQNIFKIINIRDLKKKWSLI